MLNLYTLIPCYVLFNKVERLHDGSLLIQKKHDDEYLFMLSGQGEHVFLFVKLNSVVLYVYLFMSLSSIIIVAQ